MTDISVNKLAIKMAKKIKERQEKSKSKPNKENICLTNFEKEMIHQRIFHSQKKFEREIKENTNNLIVEVKKTSYRREM